jgi:hypothetical protein
MHPLLSIISGRSNSEELRKDNPVKEMVIHVLVAVVVIALSHYLGHEIAVYFHAP